MDPLLVAAYSSTARRPVRKTGEAEDAFYDRHGGRWLRGTFPAASAVAVVIALVVVAGLAGQ